MNQKDELFFLRHLALVSFAPVEWLIMKRTTRYFRFFSYQLQPENAALWKLGVATWLDHENKMIASNVTSISSWTCAEQLYSNSISNNNNPLMQLLQLDVPLIEAQKVAPKWPGESIFCVCWSWQTSDGNCNWVHDETRDVWWKEPWMIGEFFWEKVPPVAWVSVMLASNNTMGQCIGCIESWSKFQSIIDSNWDIKSDHHNSIIIMDKDRADRFVLFICNLAWQGHLLRRRRPPLSWWEAIFDPSYVGL